MKIVWRLVLVFVLLVITTIYVLTFTNGKSPKSQCSINDLGLDEKWMPQGWLQNEIGPAFLPQDDKLGAQQAYYIAMENAEDTDNHSAHHTVYQYSNSWLATFHFWLERETFFPSVGWKWLEVPENNNLSLHADQIQIKCGKSNDPFLDNRCTAILRYGPYISDFSSSIEEGIMDREEFRKVVFEIDKLFSSCAL